VFTSTAPNLKPSEERAACLPAFSLLSICVLSKSSQATGVTATARLTELIGACHDSGRLFVLQVRASVCVGACVSTLVSARPVVLLLRTTQVPLLPLIHLHMWESCAAFKAHAVHAERKQTLSHKRALGQHPPSGSEACGLYTRDTFYSTLCVPTTSPLQTQEYYCARSRDDVNGGKACITWAANQLAMAES
jgi:hypothetical protein